MALQVYHGMRSSLKGAPTLKDESRFDHCVKMARVARNASNEWLSALKDSAQTQGPKLNWDGFYPAWSSQ